MSRIAELGVRTSCIWGFGSAGLLVVAVLAWGPLSTPVGVLLTAMGLLCIAEAGLLATQPRARSRLRAWNRAYWARKVVDAALLALLQGTV